MKSAASGSSIVARFKNHFLDQFLTSPSNGSGNNEDTDKFSYNNNGDFNTNNQSSNMCDKIFSSRMEYKTTKSSTIGEKNILNEMKLPESKTPLWSMRDDGSESKVNNNSITLGLNLKNGNNNLKVIKKNSNTPSNGFNIYKNLIKDGKSGKSNGEVVAKNKKNLSAFSGNIIDFPGSITPIAKKIKTTFKMPFENNLIKSTKAEIRKQSKFNFDSNVNLKSPESEGVRKFSNLNIISKSNNIKTKNSETKTKSKVSHSGGLTSIKQTNRLSPSARKSVTSGGIIKKVKSNSIASTSPMVKNNPYHSGAKQKIISEQNLYEQIDTIPDNSDKKKNLIQQKLLSHVHKNEENESETIKFGEDVPSSSKISNTIDSKTDVYQILNHMNYHNTSENRQRAVKNIISSGENHNPLRSANKNFTFKATTEGENKNFKESEISKGGQILIQLSGRIEKEKVKKEEEFIKNRYKSLLSEYFTC